MTETTIHPEIIKLINRFIDKHIEIGAYDKRIHDIYEDYIKEQGGINLNNILDLHKEVHNRHLTINTMDELYLKSMDMGNRLLAEHYHKQGYGMILIQEFPKTIFKGVDLNACREVLSSVVLPDVIERENVKIESREHNAKLGFVLDVISSMTRTELGQNWNKPKKGDTGVKRCLFELFDLAKYETRLAHVVNILTSSYPTTSVSFLNSIMHANHAGMIKYADNYGRLLPSHSAFFTALSVCVSMTNKYRNENICKWLFNSSYRTLAEEIELWNICSQYIEYMLDSGFTALDEIDGKYNIRNIWLYNPILLPEYSAVVMELVLPIEVLKNPTEEVMSQALSQATNQLDDYLFWHDKTLNEICPRLMRESRFMVYNLEVAKKHPAAISVNRFIEGVEKIYPSERASVFNTVFEEASKKFSDYHDIHASINDDFNGRIRYNFLNKLIVGGEYGPIIFMPKEYNNNNN